MSGRTGARWAGRTAGAAGPPTRRVLPAAGRVAFVGLSAAALKLPFFCVDGRAGEDRVVHRHGHLGHRQEADHLQLAGLHRPPRKTDLDASVFERAPGIEVNYTDDVNDNAEFFAKVKNQLGSCEPIKRDMIVLTDWMAARMIGLGWIQKLDARQDPQRRTRTSSSRSAGPAWDPDCELPRARGRAG